MLNCVIYFFQKKEPPPKTTSLNGYFSRNTFIRRKTGLLLQTLFFSSTCVHFVLLSLCNQCRQCPSATQQNYTGHFCEFWKCEYYTRSGVFYGLNSEKSASLTKRARGAWVAKFSFSKNHKDLMEMNFLFFKNLPISSFYWPPTWAKLFLIWSKENQKQFEFS